MADKRFYRYVFPDSIMVNAARVGTPGTGEQTVWTTKRIRAKAVENAVLPTPQAKKDPNKQSYRARHRKGRHRRRTLKAA